ncbi:hypothetical protein ACWGDX_01410 [Streptomyces sp. NPDC055025]
MAGRFVADLVADDDAWAPRAAAERPPSSVRPANSQAGKTWHTAPRGGEFPLRLNSPHA